MMGIFFFDDRTQLALLMAGLVGGAGVGLGACEDTQVMDPVPTDMRVEKRRDGPYLDDPVPRDMVAKKDQPWVVDPLPVDMGKKDGVKKDQPWVVDPLPVDMGKKKDFWLVDPAPVDASAGWSTPAPKPQPRPGSALPLERELRANIRTQRRGAQLELSARVEGEARSGLTYRWKANGGALDHTDRATARWTPPTEKGRYLVQLTVRDGKHTISVDAYIYEVK